MTFQPKEGAAVWVFPVGAEVVEHDGLTLTWADDDGVSQSLPAGFVVEGSVTTRPVDEIQGYGVRGNPGQGFGEAGE